MASKSILALCAAALVQSVYSQCLGIAAPLRAPCGSIAPAIAPARSYGCGIGADISAASALNAAWGGGLGVASSSAVPPTGLNVASENVYEGNVAVAGNLPFLGTVAMEGVFPSAGAGAVSYGCGNGAVGITAEGIAPAGIPSAIDGIGYAGLGYAGLGYNGVGGRIGGCGCGAIY